MSTSSKTVQEEAKIYLHKHISPGERIYTVLRHVSKSGMMRIIDVFLIDKDCKPFRISWSVAEAIGYPYDRKHEGVKVNGCGMDMGFEIVYNLGHALFPDGFNCVGIKKCRSNDHSNGDRNYTPHRHNDGGYALKHEWI